MGHSLSRFVVLGYVSSGPMFLYFGTDGVLISGSLKSLYYNPIGGKNIWKLPH